MSQKALGSEKHRSKGIGTMKKRTEQDIENGGNRLDAKEKGETKRVFLFAAETSK